VKRGAHDASAVTRLREVRLSGSFRPFKIGPREKLVVFQQVHEADEELEPSIFCMASASGRSLPFASVRKGQILGMRPRGCYVPFVPFCRTFSSRGSQAGIRSAPERATLLTLNRTPSRAGESTLLAISSTSPPTDQTEYLALLGALGLLTGLALASAGEDAR